MTSEKILTMVTAAAEMLDAEDKASFDAYSRLIREGKETVNICCTAGMLASLKYELERDIATASAKKSGKPNYRKALERIYKNVDAERRPTIAGVWVDKENRACVCDGYRALRLYSADELALDGLRMVDAKTAFDIDHVMPARSGSALRWNCPPSRSLIPTSRLPAPSMAQSMTANDRERLHTCFLMV